MPKTQLAASSLFSHLRRLVLASVAVAVLAVVGVTALAVPDPIAAQSRIDFDHDNDGFIEVSDIRQFEVIRYDLDTDGVPDSANASAWNAAFPRAKANMGCPPSGCIGYELVSDIYISPRSYDTTNFEPIGTDSEPFTGRIKGNGNLIVNLRINRPSTNQVGLFGSTAAGSIIESLGVTDPLVKGGEDVGVIVGKSLGTVRNSYAVGRRNVNTFVEGTSNVGGLVGTMGSGASISTSYARIHVVASTDNAGGLIGTNAGGTCTNSYYSGDVDSIGSVQGLVVGAHGSGSYSGCVGDSSTDTTTANTNSAQWRQRQGSVIGSIFVDADHPTTDAAGSGTAEGASVETYAGLASLSQIYASFGYDYYTYNPAPFDEWNIDVDGDRILDYPWYFGEGNTPVCRSRRDNALQQPFVVCVNPGDLPVLQHDGHNPQLQHDLVVPRTARYISELGLPIAQEGSVNVCARTLVVANEILRALAAEGIQGDGSETCTLHSDLQIVTIANLQQLGRNETLDLSGKSLTELRPGDFDYLTGYPLRINLSGGYGRNPADYPTDNQLTTLPSGLFRGLKIAHLNLSGNKITHLPWDLFGTGPGPGAARDTGPGPGASRSECDTEIERLTQAGCHFSSVLLHDNQLTENGLPPAIFDPLSYLNALTLHTNAFDKVNTRWFQNLPYLGDTTRYTYTQPWIERPFQRTDRPFIGLYLHGNGIRWYHYDGGSGLAKPVIQTWYNDLSSLRSEIKSRISSATQTGRAPNLDLDSTDYWEPRWQYAQIDPDFSNADDDERVDTTATLAITLSDGETYTLTADIWNGRLLSSCGTRTQAHTVERNFQTSDCWVIPHYSSPSIQAAELTETCDGSRSPMVRQAIYTDASIDLECPSAASNGVVAAERLWGIVDLHMSYQEIGGLKAGDFDGLQNLVSLRLDGNELRTESIPPTVFWYLPNLTGLYLDENQLLHINTAWFERGTKLGDSQFDGGLGMGLQLEEDGVTEREVRTFYYSVQPGGPVEGEGTAVEYYDKEQLRTEILRVITRYAGGSRPATLDLSVPFKYVGPEPYFATAAPPPLTVTAPGGRQSLQVTFLHRPRAADNPIIRIDPDQITSYEYRYRVLPADPSDAWGTEGWFQIFPSRLFTAGPRSFTIPGLEPSTSYQVQVRPLMGGARDNPGTSSTYTPSTAAGESSVEVTFTHTPTPGTAPDPGGVHEVSHYEYRYRARPSDLNEPWTAIWRRATLPNLDREGQQSITIYGLDPSTIYQVQLRAVSNEERGRSSAITTITSGTLVNLPEINRIEPTITELTVQTGQDIRLEVDVFGLADRLDNSIPNADGSNLVFSWTESPATGGRFQDPNDGRRVTYTAPDLPGQYQIVAEASPNGICRPHHESAFGISDEQRAKCVATFNLRVTRAPSYVTSTAAPVNPAGLIPSSLTDDAGVAYSVFTPVEGGTFTGDGITVTAAPGAVPDQELIAVSAAVSPLPVPESGPTSRLTVGGRFYAVNGVQRSGDAPVTGYTLDDPLLVCLPMPAEFRGNISDIVLVDRRADGTLGMLGSRVRVAEGVVSACGNVSRLPVTLAVARLGAPVPILPEPTPAPEAPDTGATAPSATGAVATLMLGILTLVVLTAATVFATVRRRQYRQSV